MTLPDYLADMAAQMRSESEAIRRDFATHRPSAGDNREQLVETFLHDHLPERFGVSSGLVISHDGMFSNQADLVVVDRMSNAPLYGTARNKLWPVEAVYSLVEIKTVLTPTELRDAVAKGRRFKRLSRRFHDTGAAMRISDSLFVIWGFESPLPMTFKANLLDALAEVPSRERPDFVVVPDRLLACAGGYLELSRMGMPGSPHHQRVGEIASSTLPLADVYDLGTNSLLGWYIWFDSWLRQAGPRFTSPVDYLPVDVAFGRKI